MRRHLVFVTQVVDPVDPVLGFVAALIRGLASAFDEVTVIGNEVRASPPFPANVAVRSLGKERGAGSLARGLRYERILLDLRNADALLAHMCPDYLTAAAPIARAAGMSSLLWFAHPADSPRLRLAETVADAVLTSMPGAYPRPARKVRVIGQAIDVRAVPLAGDPPAGPLILLGLGRTSDSKRYDVAIDALAKTRARGVDATLRIVGPATTPNERAVRAALHRQIATLDLGPHVTLEDGVPPGRVPELIASSSALINTTVDGSADKTVFEAMASGRPVFVSNPVFADLLQGLPVDLSFPSGDAAALASRIESFASGATDLPALARGLRERVMVGHSLEHWAASVRDVVDGLRSRP